MLYKSYLGFSEEAVLGSSVPDLAELSQHVPIQTLQGGPDSYPHTQSNTCIGSTHMYNMHYRRCPGYPQPLAVTTHLFDAHHGLHVLAGVAHRYGGQAAVPVDKVVVDVAPHKTQHVAEVWLVFGDH